MFYRKLIGCVEYRIFTASVSAEDAGTGQDGSKSYSRGVDPKSLRTVPMRTTPRCDDAKPYFSSTFHHAAPPRVTELAG